jgi:hypothetical protein
VLSPFDDFPIHPSADPIAHPATGDPNHYDRYWFNGHQRDGDFYFAVSMGHYPVRNVCDSAFSVMRRDGVQHSIFASGHMPLDRATAIGPVRLEVVEPMREIRYIVEPNEHRVECDLTFRASTAAIEEPRHRQMMPNGVLVADYTRLTQWGSWEGTISVDGDELRVEAGDVPGSRDRSWGVRQVGKQAEVNRRRADPSQLRIWWLWAPLCFEDRFTHYALHEQPDGSRVVETALVLEPLTDGAAPWKPAGVRECSNLRYEIEYRRGRREMNAARIGFDDPVEGAVEIELEKVFPFRMSGIGYWHPYWGHGSNHGKLETGRESIKTEDFDPLEMPGHHIMNLVIARMGHRKGVGALEEIHVGPHAPTGLTGVLDGFDL